MGCGRDAVFAVKEVQLGLAADIGTLQRSTHPPCRALALLLVLLLLVLRILLLHLLPLSVL